MKLQILFVQAHPDPGSFTAAMTQHGRAALERAGHHVDVSDLHADEFNPVPGRHDFTAVANAARFHYQTEQEHASRTGGFAPDLAREQEKLARAHLLVFTFPIWWGGVPAILKGWFDRVCAYGFAYADGKRYDAGYFRGRRGLLGIVTGGTVERFARDGVYGEMRDVIYPVQHCMLEYLGLEVAAPFVAYAAPRVDAPAREAYLRAWEQRLLALVEDPAWHPPDDPAADLARQHRLYTEAGGWAAKR